MKNLIKIKSIDKFRFFNQFRWDENVPCFGKYNIIYGWNGSGKSTLCDMLHNIEKGELFKDNQKFQIQFQEGTEPSVILNKGNIPTESYRLKVFHQNYVDKLVSQPDLVNHIYIIGDEEGKAVAEIEELKKRNKCVLILLINIK